MKKGGILFDDTAPNFNIREVNEIDEIRRFLIEDKINNFLKILITIACKDG